MAIDTASLESSSFLVLSGADVDQVLNSTSAETLIAGQAQAFKAFSVGLDVTPPAIQTPHRISLFSPENLLLFMPSRVVSGGGMACKIVAVPTKSGTGGLPASTLVLDEKTGKVQAVVNARRLTSMRNAAGSSLFLKSFPGTRPLKNMVLYGSGAQARSHALVILEVFPSIEQCTVVGRSRTERSEALVVELQAAFPKIKISLAVSTYPEPTTVLPSQTIREADLVVCVTPAIDPLFDSADVTPGTRIVSIGSYKAEMHELDQACIKRAGLIVCDSRDACLREAGELMLAKTPRDGVVEIGEVLADPSLINEVEATGDIVLYKSVSEALEGGSWAN